jgi:predicted nucleic acid-binding protein
MVVVDASVAVKWVVREPGSDKAMSLLVSGQVMVAPDLIKIEGASAITRAYRSERLSREDADNTLRHWHDYMASGVLALIESDRDLDRAAELSCQLRHPLPDCLYLALAQRLAVGLVTADGTFARRAPAAYPHVSLLLTADA